MHNVRRIAFALAVPLVAVGAIAVTAGSALSSPTAVPAAATVQPGQQNQKYSPGGGLQQFTNYTFYTGGGNGTTNAPPTGASSASPSMSSPSMSSSSASPSSSASSSASASTTPGASGGVAGATMKNCAGKVVKAPLTVKVATVKNSQALVDGDGCTLYLFTKDTQTASACDASCLATWLPAPGPATAGQGTQQQNFGTFARAGGFTQVSYFGKQLYYFSGDHAPGDANGQTVDQSWYIVDPSGNAITQ